MFYIRPARIEDRESCIAIAKMYPDTKSFSVPWYSGIELFVDMGGSEDIWVLDEGGVAGFYSARFRRRDHVVNLEYIAVAITNQGLGQALLDHLLSRVRTSGTHQVVQSKTGRRSRSFWVRNRFELTDEGRGVWSI